MVAQRQATRTQRPAAAHAAKAGRLALRGSGGDEPDDPVARELASLQAIRADALKWVAEIERRISALEIDAASDH